MNLFHNVSCLFHFHYGAMSSIYYPFQNNMPRTRMNPITFYAFPLTRHERANAVSNSLARATLSGVSPFWGRVRMRDRTKCTRTKREQKEKGIRLGKEKQGRRGKKGHHGIPRGYDDEKTEIQRQETKCRIWRIQDGLGVPA